MIAEDVRVRIVTWNVNSLRARIPRVLQLLDEHRPDVACLQETKCAPDTFPEAELADAGYAAVHHSAGQWAGVAVLAREGLTLSDPVLELDGDPVPGEARWCEATVDGIRVASAYVPNGRTWTAPSSCASSPFWTRSARGCRRSAPGGSCWPGT